MFGRGVRLKGYQGLLKRSHALSSSVHAPQVKHFGKLETLTLFGVKANYMVEFKKFLEMEGNLLYDNNKTFTAEIKATPYKSLSGDIRLYAALVENKTRKNIADEYLSYYGASTFYANWDTVFHFVMKKFRDASIQILVATDIAARGLDVEGITHVISYDVPRDVETYIHRIGRTGRAGQEGSAIMLVTSDEIERLRRIEKGIKKSIAVRQPARK